MANTVRPLAVLALPVGRFSGTADLELGPGRPRVVLEGTLDDARPDLIATAFFGTTSSIADAWTAARHPVARRQMRAVPVVHLDGAWTSCGGWFLVDAVEALSRGVSGARR